MSLKELNRAIRARELAFCVPFDVTAFGDYSVTKIDSQTLIEHKSAEPIRDALFQIQAGHRLLWPCGDHTQNVYEYLCKNTQHFIFHVSRGRIVVNNYIARK